MPLSNRHILAIGLGLSCAAGAAAQAQEGTLRLNLQAPAKDASVQDAPAAATLDELLSMTPRASGLNLNLDADRAHAEDMPDVRLDFGDQAAGVGYQIFGSVGDARGDRVGISGLQAQGLSLGAPASGPLALAAPDDSRGGEWRVGGRIDYAGFSFGADMAREWRLAEGAGVRDYRLGMSYGGEDWRVGMQYMRSLSGDQQRLTAISDAVELGGVWNVSRSVNLVGGVQLWDQEDISSLDSDSQRAALIFLGTRIQF